MAVIGSMIRTGLAVCVLVLAAGAMQTTIWVDAVAGDDSSFDPTDPESPYLTIGKAVDAANVGSGDYIIKVVEGNYTHAHEQGGGASSPGYPIEITRAGIMLESESEDEEERARLGGDVEDSEVEALIIVSASTLEDPVTIQRLIFKGQDIEDVEAPSGLWLRGEDTQGAVITGNKFERSEMNGTQAPHRPTILVGGDSSGAGISNCEISWNIIEASTRAAIEVIGPGSVTALSIARNTVRNATGTTSAYGVRWSGVERTLSGYSEIVLNSIQSSGGGVGTGVSVEVALSDQDEVQSNFNVGRIIGNTIAGCADAGIELCSDDGANVTVGSLHRNTIRGNGGSGIRCVFDPGSDGDGLAYINFNAEGNLIVDNGGFGYEFAGLGPESSSAKYFVNETIAGNAGAAFGFVDWFDPEEQITEEEFAGSFVKLANAILWGNDHEGSYDQVVGLNEELLQAMIDFTSYSIWEGLATPLYDNNLNSDPLFVDESGGDFHLDTGSPAIDSGRAPGNVTAVIDIDIEDRVQDGNFNCTGSPQNVVDRGADEVPEPDCP